MWCRFIAVKLYKLCDVAGTSSGLKNSDCGPSLGSDADRTLVPSAKMISSPKTLSSRYSRDEVLTSDKRTV